MTKRDTPLALGAPCPHTEARTASKMSSAGRFPDGCARRFGRLGASASALVLLCLLAACGAPGGSPAHTEDLAGPTRAIGCVAPPTDSVPQRLSETGCFEDTDPSQPRPGLIPFVPNAPLWTDGAEKERWFSIPAGQRISLDERGDFQMPVGSVLIKHFRLEGKLIETRLLMHHEDGWQGYPYQWNEAGDEALLVREGARIEGAVADGRAWQIPSSGSCQSCHTPQTHATAGLELAQLNGDFHYPGKREPENQLTHLQDLGLLPPLEFSPERLPRLADYRNEQAPLDERARAYLHANCASCHTTPQGLCSGDLRWSADLQQMGVCGVDAKFSLSTHPGATKLVAPGRPDESALFQRMAAPVDSPQAMPPVGRAHPDQMGIALIQEWIQSLEDCDG